MLTKIAGHLVAREIVRQSLKKQGIKLSHISAKEIMAAAKELYNEYGKEIEAALDKLVQSFLDKKGT